MSILTEYSLWFILLCVALGVIFAFALYFRNRNTDFDKRAAIVMSVLRGVSVTLISILLLAPMLKLSVRESDKPLLIFAIDNSESMASTQDSTFYRSDFQVKMDKLIHDFGDKYEIKTYLIGETNKIASDNEPFKADFTDKATNISSLFEEVDNLYANHNVGAMVLVSDGIYNSGSNPQYQAEKLKFPIHTVATGDTTIQTDALIADIIHNRQTFIGNYFPVEIKVAANHLAGKQAVLNIYENENVVFTKNIDIRGNQHFETVKTTMEAQKKGLQKYRVTLTRLDGEITYKNNESSFFIEVVDSRERIAIVYAAPHPDVAAIKQAVETSDKYEVETFSADGFNKNPNDYSLFILHQLPSQTNVGGNLLSKIRQNGIPALYIIGKQTNLTAFNQFGAGLSINASQRGQTLFNESMPYFNDNFLAFTFSEEARQMLKNYTPLVTYFGNYQTAVGTNVFMFQKINNVESNYPLISFYEHDQTRTGVIAGTDIWRWRMQNYLRTQNFDAFDEIINKIALYLSVKGDRSYFRVHCAELFNENTPVELSAEVYNESYELVNTPDVRFKLTDASGKEFNSLFSKQNNSYSLNLGKLPVGDYQWVATTSTGTGTYTKSGHFTVQEVLLESMSLVANHDLLRTISQQSQGRFFTIDQLEQVEKAIKDNDTIKPVVTYNKKYSPLLNSWIYLVIIVLLLGIEWFMRKWGGGY